MSAPTPPTFFQSARGFYSFAGSGGQRLGGAQIVDAVARPDGSLVVLAAVWRSSETQTDFGLMCIRGDGSIDTSFGDQGFAYVDLEGRRLVHEAEGLPAGSPDQPAALALQPDGGIVVVGSTDAVLRQVNSDGSTELYPIMPLTVAARFEATGELDRSFGDEGKLLLPMRQQAYFQGAFSRYAAGGAADVAVQPDGRILIVGMEGFAGTHGDAAIARLLPDGRLDTAFGGYADWDTPNAAIPGASFVKQTTARHPDRTFSGSGERFTQVVVAPDGAIFAAGTTWWGGPATDAFVVRFDATGRPDPGFGREGRVIIDFGQSADGQASDVVHAMLLQADGRLVIAGSTTGTAGSIAIARLEPDGSLDTDFAGDGRLTLATWPSVGERADVGTVRSLLPGPDGSLLAIIETGSASNVLIVRLGTDGTLDPRFGDAGRVYVDPRDPTRIAEDWAGASAVVAVAGDDGRISILGRKFSTGSRVEDDISLVRILAGNGRVDESLLPLATSDAMGFVPQYEWRPPDQDSPPMLLNPSVRIWDAEHILAGEFGGSVFELRRSGGADPRDQFAAAEGYGLTPLIEGQAFGRIFEPLGDRIGVVERNSDGILRLRFADGATEAQVNATLSSIGYRFVASDAPHGLDSPPLRTAFTWTFHDGDPADASSRSARIDLEILLTRADRDMQRPYLIDLHPLQGAGDVPLDTREIVLRFSEPVLLTETPLRLSRIDPTTGQGVEIASSTNPGQIFVRGGDAVVVSLPEGLAAGARYQLRHDYPAVRDAAGNGWDASGMIEFRASAAGSPESPQEPSGRHVAGDGGDNRLTGSADNESFDGLGGIDTVAFTGPRADYGLQPLGAGRYRVTDGVAERDGIDLLDGVERISFADRQFAIDLAPGQAGDRAARLIGVVAPPLIAEPAIVGTVLNLFDAGHSLESAFQLLVDLGILAALAGPVEPPNVARLAFRNIVRAEPEAGMVDMLASFMDGRAASYSPARFLAEVANLELNATQIGLVGLQETGLPYL